MESNKVEAQKAMDMAEKTLSANDFNGAKKLVKEAQKLNPNLDGLKQMLVMIDVFISAGSKGGREADWYRILHIDPLASDEVVKKQYKKLALLLHPDKNKFNGAEEAFKLVGEAWTLLSDKAKRHAYDQKRKSKNSWKENKQEKPHEPEPDTSSYYYSYKQNKQEKPHEPEPEPDTYSYKPRPTPPEASTFWTKCNRCHTFWKLLKSTSLNKILPCPNCSEDFVATEIASETSSDGRRVFRFNKYVQPQSEYAKADPEPKRKWKF